jgi:hypothetical protein
VGASESGALDDEEAEAGATPVIAAIHASRQATTRRARAGEIGVRIEEAIDTQTGQHEQ